MAEIDSIGGAIRAFKEPGFRSPEFEHDDPSPIIEYLVEQGAPELKPHLQTFLTTVCLLKGIMTCWFVL